MGVTVKNRRRMLGRCLESIAEQQLSGYALQLVLLDDGSDDGWLDEHGNALDAHDAIVLASNCGSPARARNAILDYVDRALPDCRWVARLDSDDRFTEASSLSAIVAVGDERDAKWVLGGNRLVSERRLLTQVNPARPDDMTPHGVVAWLRGMADGTSENELPSCNLLLRRGAGFRYPDARSAEDHWLVADLLINHTGVGAVCERPFYCDYTLSGGVSTANRDAGRHERARRRLADAARCWLEDEAFGGELLGYGQEGVVRRLGDRVQKRFYPGAFDSARVEWLRSVLDSAGPTLPSPRWRHESERWVCDYLWTPGEVPTSVTRTEARDFLLGCLRAGLVCLNIKRSNFVRDSDGLTYIDVGASIRPMHVDYFCDSAARLFAMSAGFPEEELRRRSRGTDVLAHPEELPGFAEFYREVMSEYASTCWASVAVPSVPEHRGVVEDVSLLIKACPQDADSLGQQVRHIVSQLEWPRRFRERILAIDGHRGPYVRQFSEGDAVELVRAADELFQEGTVDRVVFAPDDPAQVEQINTEWFDVQCSRSHSKSGVPVAPQLWAFDQVGTRFVLQCDVDVLIGRAALGHDYLAEMLAALRQPGVLSVGFNIAQASESVFRDYDAAPGEYVPEVRCGLIDLERLRACRPLPNSVQDGSLSLTWYRSVQRHQVDTGLRSLRGGDPRTFYVHPPNDWKRDAERLAVARDLIGQARVPAVQRSEWDLAGQPADWGYAPRYERLVVLAKGRDTPAAKVRRFVASLMAQDDQTFGVVVIDDGSGAGRQTLLPELLRPLEPRMTLVRRSERQGRLPNFVLGVTEICQEPETHIVVVDLDDALMAPNALGRIGEAADLGHEVVLGAMYRPDKPTRLYKPTFDDVRECWGGDVWIHLRSFRKRLFDRVPLHMFMLDGEWIAECTDYATMVPMVELAERPLYIPEYLYFHERTGARTAESRARKDELIQRILEKGRLSAEVRRRSRGCSDRDWAMSQNGAGESSGSV